MSTFTGLNTMVRGITMQQLSLNTVGHNITNAGTEGYSRQYAAPVATMAEHRSGLYGALAVGTGVDALSLRRSRDIYADFQYRQENTTQEYYETMAMNFDKLEVIFNDTSETGVAAALSETYKSWVALSTEGPTAANRVEVISKSKILADTMQTTAKQLQEQINSQYDELKTHTEYVDTLLERITVANKQIVAAEADGSMANDLRDQRDLLCDDLSKYITVSITENEVGAYQISSNGCMLVNGLGRLHLEFGRGISSKAYGADYGIEDHMIEIHESDQVYQPINGILKAHFDSIQDCKDQIDYLANIAAYMFTALNDLHAAGYDMTGERGRNFFGLTDKSYSFEFNDKQLYNYIQVTDKTTGEVTELSGITAINSLNVNTDFDKVGGYKYIAAATAYRDVDDNNEWLFYTADTDMTSNVIEWGNRTGDGTNATYISELFNMTFEQIVQSGRAISAVIQKYTEKDSNGNEVLDSSGKPVYKTPLGKNSINGYYQTAMTQIAVDAEAMDTKIAQHEGIMTQIQNWRDSASGVDWNEELTNMIKYQKAYGSCARMLTAMDECLDRLVNNTGMVGR